MPKQQCRLNVLESNVTQVIRMLSRIPNLFVDFSLFVSELSGWRRAVAAFSAGLLSCLALPPFYLVPVLIASFGVLVWLIDSACTPGSVQRTSVSKPLWRRALSVFVIGWCFGFGQFLFGLYWISSALLVDATSFGWAVPLSAAVLPACLAFFPAFGLSGAAVIWSRGVGRIALLAIVWTGAEWLRGHVLTGFPWNLIGYVWTETGVMIQSVALVGIYGLGAMTVFAVSAPAVLADKNVSRQVSWLTVGFGATLIAVFGIWGGGRLAVAKYDFYPDVTVRVVQPNIEQHLKWRRDQRHVNFKRLLDLTAAPGASAITHVIWPEAATPYYLGQELARRAEIAAHLLPQQVLLTGTLRRDIGPNGEPRSWNSFLALDDRGRIQNTYDKSHLVPFGEYLPFRGILSAMGIEKITAGLGDYSAGPGRTTLQVTGAPPFSPLICYEVIFPAEVASAHPRPAWLLNVTNDAWYGKSTGPHQHFAMAQVRAVEEGLPLVRAANTGISAIIDPYGRKIAQLGLGEGGVLDAPLPRALGSIPLYARWGDWACTPILLIFALFMRIYRKKY